MRPALAGMFTAVLCATLAASSPARAQQEQPGYEVDYAIDGSITFAAATASLLISLVPVDTAPRWDRELFGSIDLSVRDNFSISAAKLSDALIAGTMLTPVLVQLDRGIDEDAGRRALLYGQTLSVSLLFNAIAKRAVQRPRPYNYHPSSRVGAYARTQGSDSHTSFYSGHAAMAFTASVAGSYLFSLGSTDERARAALWGLQFTLASTTAHLRVRAGKHFYSDILIGALVGCAVGYAVPALHADDRGVYQPTAAEWGAMASGLVAGSLIGHFMPLDEDVAVPVDGELMSSARIVPIAHRDGAGLGLMGTF